MPYLQRPGSEEQKGRGGDVDLAGGAHEVLARGGNVREGIDDVGRVERGLDWYSLA